MAKNQNGSQNSKFGDVQINILFSADQEELILKKLSGRAIKKEMLILNSCICNAHIFANHKS